MLNTLTFKFDIPDSLLPEEDIVTLDWGYLTGDINNQTDLVNLIDKKVTDSSAVIYNKIKDISTDINNINGRVDTLNDRLTQKVNSTDFENYQLSVYTKEEVYTKTEADSQINAAKPDLEPYAKKTDIPEMPDLSPYAKKTDIPNTSQFVTNTSVNANYSKIGHTHSQYLTEHQSLDGYATDSSVSEHYSKIGHTHPEYLTEHQSLEDYATKDYVDTHVPEIDTTSLDSSISDISTRLNTLTSNFNTLVGNEESVNGTINTFKEMESFLQDISDASTLTGLMETEHKKLEDKIDNIKVPTQTSELENNSGFITIDDVDLSVYVKSTDLENEYTDTETLENIYATKDEVSMLLGQSYKPYKPTYNVTSETNPYSESFPASLLFDGDLTTRYMVSSASRATAQVDFTLDKPVYVSGIKFAHNNTDTFTNRTPIRIQLSSGGVVLYDSNNETDFNIDTPNLMFSRVFNEYKGPYQSFRLTLTGKNTIDSFTRTFVVSLSEFELDTYTPSEVFTQDEADKLYAPIEHTHDQYALKEDVLELQLFKFPNATIFGTPTINNGQVYNFSANNYLQFPFIVSLSNYGFTINMCFTTYITTGQLNIFDSKYGLAFAIKDLHFIIAYGTNGTSWANLFTGSYRVQNNTTYYVKILWYGMDSGDLNVIYSLDNKNWDLDIYDYMSQPPYPTQVIIGKSLDNKYPFQGSINLNYCSLTMPDGNVWNGMDDAGLGTRLAVDMSNIDAAGEQKIKDIVGVVPETPDLSQYAKKSDLSNYATTSSLSNYINKTSTATNVIKGKFQVGEYTDNITNAYLHIRNVGSNSITGYNVNGACFAVNGDGTASFQHKTYADNGTGAKNSAVLRFSNKGIQFAVNSGTGASPSEDMYKELATQNYVDTQIGDIKTILESI